MTTAEAIREDFLSRLAFPTDPFQEESMDALDRGANVLVTAPTGSGKTLVAAYAIDQALREGKTSFYTTPLKALSNQKYREFVAEYGTAAVGLLTGDTVINPGAAIVVMTTEVLRNMLLAESPHLATLSVVVLDEVHFLQDPYRGGVWEEVLILSPPTVTFVCLSATVSNAKDLGAWIASIRGETAVIGATERPIALRHHVAVQRRGQVEPELIDLLDGDRPSTEGLRLDGLVRRSLEQRRGSAYLQGRHAGALPIATPRRAAVVELLDAEQLLPAIVFIFSRAACDDAVRHCLRMGIRLTTSTERRRIVEIAEHHVTQLTDEDLGVLGFNEWLDALCCGVAAHHAGMVPAFREAVEQCLQEGLLGVVFATETLALGINVPARTTVIERFTKFAGAGRTTLTSGEYAQLTGRAGRRGLDEEGHAVTVFSTESSFADMAKIATAPSPQLRSSFKPTYNLVCNLVRRYDPETAHQLVNRSFAAWEAAKRPAGASSGGPSGQLDRRIAVLQALHYADGWSLTPSGLILGRIYHECDLILAEGLGLGLFDDVEPAVLVAILSSLVFERRRAKPTREHVVPKSKKKQQHQKDRRGVRGDRLGGTRRSVIEDRTSELVVAGERVRLIEESHGLHRSRLPEPGLATAMASWVRGASFATVMEVAAAEIGEIAPGDFVRAVKQLADLTGQVAMVAADQRVAETARIAVDALLRSVVTAGGARGIPEDAPAGL